MEESSAPKVEEKAIGSAVEEKDTYVENLDVKATSVEIPIKEKTADVGIPVIESAIDTNIPVEEKAAVDNHTAEEKKSDSIPDEETTIKTVEEEAAVDNHTANEKKSDNIPDEETTIKTVEYKALPESMKKRIKALKVLQLKILENDAKYYQDVFKLEMKYDVYLKDIVKKRLSILNGEYEPTEEECNYPSQYDKCEDDDKCKIERQYFPAYNENDKGIPKFWLMIFENSSLLNKAFYEDDKPILDHLRDITIKYHESPFGFTLEFSFSENEYFTNEVLTKYYKLSIEPSKTNPFSFNGKKIIDFKGCQIDWKEGKNVTIKPIRKLKIMSRLTSIKSVMEPIKKDSFFNFFNPPQISKSLSEETDVDNEIINNDLEIALHIKDWILPRTVLYYTNEIYYDDDYVEDSYEGEEDEEDEEEEED